MRKHKTICLGRRVYALSYAICIQRNGHSSHPLRKAEKVAQNKVPKALLMFPHPLSFSVAATIFRYTTLSISISLDCYIAAGLDLDVIFCISDLEELIRHGGTTAIGLLN